MARLVAVVLGLWVSLLAPSASSVVPNAGRIERLMSGSPPPTGAALIELEERGDGGKATAALRLEVSSSEVTLVEQDLTTLATRSVTWHRSVEPGSPGQYLSSAPAWLQLLAGTPARQVIRSLGVDRKTTSLGLAGHTVLWVLGAGPRSRVVPQLHVERKTGRLRRIIEQRPPAPNSGPRGPLLDVSLSGAAGESGPAAAWPGRIDMTEAGRRRVLVVTSFRVPKVPTTVAPTPSP